MLVEKSDTLIDIENIAGSTVDDDITGNDSVNTLFGMSRKWYIKVKVGMIILMVD